MLVSDIYHLDLFTSHIVGNLLFCEMCRTPLGNTFGVAIRINPCITLLCLSGLLLFERLRADELDITLVGIILEVAGELAAVVQFDFLAMYHAAVFQDTYLFHRKLGFADVVLYKDFIHRHGLDFVGEAVNADQTFLHLSCHGVGKFHNFAEVAGFEKLLLIFFRELVATEGNIKFGLVLDEVWRKGKTSVGLLLEVGHQE